MFSKFGMYFDGMVSSGKTKDSEHVERERLWQKKWSCSGWNQVTDRLGQSTKRTRNNQNVRLFANNEDFLGRGSLDFDEEGHGAGLELEAVKRVKLREEHRWSPWLKEKRVFQFRIAKQEERVSAGWRVNVKDVWQEELLWTPFVGLFANVTEAIHTGFPCLQGVAVDWVFSSRIKFVGLDRSHCVGHKW